MQKYMADKTFISTNLTVANRLDTLKYSSAQTDIWGELSTKKEQLNNINTYIGTMDSINDTIVGPKGFITNTRINNNPLYINTGNEEDYLFFKNVFDGRIDISYSSLGDRLVKGSVSNTDVDPKKELKADKLREIID